MFLYLSSIYKDCWDGNRVLFNILIKFLEILGEIFQMKLKRRSANEMTNRDIKNEFGTNASDLDVLLDDIGKKIEKTKDTVINEILKFPENEKKTETVPKKKHKRSLKKRS